MARSMLLFLQYMFFSGLVTAEPIIVTTWNYENAVTAGWNMLMNNDSALNAVERGCSLCEEQQCRGTVGFGGSPDETGETTLDAMVMDGTTFNVGAVAGLRRIKNAVSVARSVMDHTEHTLLVGDLATQFATTMGFVEESLTTPYSENLWFEWQVNACQPNFWKNVVPDPTTSCGPYTPIQSKEKNKGTASNLSGGPENHDTIGMIAMDLHGDVAVGTSTNGLSHKIPGRVGDSPIPGAGGYADSSVGAAAATGNGDYFLRILPSLVAVEAMRQGASPSMAAETAIRRIMEKFPSAFGAVVAFNITGHYGVACMGYDSFPYTVQKSNMTQPQVLTMPCFV